jgi:hypothetical protein
MLCHDLHVFHTWVYVTCLTDTKRSVLGRFICRNTLYWIVILLRVGYFQFQCCRVRWGVLCPIITLNVYISTIITPWGIWLCNALMLILHIIQLKFIQENEWKVAKWNRCWTKWAMWSLLSVFIMQNYIP